MPVNHLATGQSVELLPVTRRHQPVCRTQRQPELVLGRHEVRIGAAVQLLLGMAQQHTLAHLVENGRHSVITELAEHCGQRHGGEVVAAETVGGEEIRCLVCRREEYGLTVGDDRRQLSAPRSRLATEYHPDYLDEVSRRTASDVRWRVNGFDIDTAGLVYSGERHSVRKYLAAQGWSIAEQTRVSLFEEYGLSTPEDDVPMRNAVAVTAHLD